MDFYIHPFKKPVKLRGRPESLIVNLTRIPISSIVLDSATDVSSGVQSDGVGLFKAGHIPSWESHPRGGQLAWRGSVNPLKLRKVWRLLCCWFASSDRQTGNFLGFRLMNKATVSSPQLKIELWISNRKFKNVQQLATTTLQDVLPACSTQFQFVANGAKLSHLQKS
jgi:hypothetical protein